MDGWQDEIENYWLIEWDGTYDLFHVPTFGQVMFEDDMDIHLYSKMIAAGVKVVSLDEFKRYLDSQLSPEERQYDEEGNRKAQEKADDEIASD